jgi:hypothetical protein
MNTVSILEIQKTAPKLVGFIKGQLDAGEDVYASHDETGWVLTSDPSQPTNQALGLQFSLVTLTF